MKLDALFEKFELIADAKGSLVAFREILLSAAFRGELVSSSDTSDSGWQLLERIRCLDTARNGSRSRRKNKAEKVVFGLHSIPAHWCWTTLGTVADWGSGSTPSRTRPEYFHGDLTWLKSGELNDNRFLSGSAERISNAALQDGSFRLNQPGDVLFAMYGATVGKVAILAEAAVTNQAVCGGTPVAGVDARYLFHFLVSQRKQFRAQSEGGAQPNFSKDKILVYPFPLPPLAEQKRIVAKVDELMALCDRLEAQEAERQKRHVSLAKASLARFEEAPTPANLTYLFHPSYDISPADLRKTILSLAVRGKLVPQDPADEPASTLLERLSEHRRVNAPSRTTDSVKPLSNGPYTLPQSWCWARFGDITINRDGERIPISKEERATRSKTYDYYGASGVIDKIDGYLFDKPLLLIGEDGANLLSRSTPIAFIASGQYWVNNHAHVIDGINEELLRYIEIYINATDLSPFVTGSAQPKMNQSKMNSIPVALAPLNEQRRIVHRVKELLALVDQLEAQLATCRSTGQELLEALVAELTAANGRAGA